MTTPPRRPFPVRRPSRLLVIGAMLVATIVVVMLVERIAVVGTLTDVIDETASRAAVAAEAPAGLAVARLLSVLGGVYVTAPLRVLVALALAVQRRWWWLGAWLASIAIAEVVVTTMKILFDRPRPPGGLEPTSLAAFPSGHAGATTVTVVTLLLLLAPRGSARVWWWAGGGALVVVMGLSRVYLRVHWLSDVAMGALVGAAAAVLAVGSLALLAE